MNYYLERFALLASTSKIGEAWEPVFVLETK